MDQPAADVAAAVAVPPPAPAPVADAERIASIDVIRGLAMLGILVMNVVEFAWPFDAYENPAYAGGSTGLDLATWFVQATLFDGKMRALFSMLFGAGLVLIDQRMQAAGRGGDAADLLLRRCLWLVPFGIVHRFVLQWSGDILYQYGLLALLAIPFRRWPARRLLALGIVVLALAAAPEVQKYRRLDTLRGDAVAAAALATKGEPVPAPLARAQKRWKDFANAIPPEPETVAAQVQAMRKGWIDICKERWDYHHLFQSTYLYEYFFWDVLGMMLLGMGLMKAGFFAGSCSPRVYRRVLVAGGMAALAVLGWAIAWQRTGFSHAALGLQLVRGAGYSCTRALVGLAWAAALLLLLRSGRLRALTAALASVGRMAFSCYIVQTLCCTLWFFGYGFGHYGDMSRSALMVVVAVVSLIQVAFSTAWLRLFRFGPLEWAWRSLTYWRRQPLLRARTPSG
jgi:uncharacterized protein